MSNIVNKLTIRQLILNKKRTFVTILGVIISAAMLTAVSTAVVSFMDLMQRNTITRTGDWHACYFGVSPQEKDLLASDDRIKSYYMDQEYGYVMLKNPKEEFKPYLKILGYDDTAFREFGIEAETGRLPENDTELVLTQDAADQMNCQLGDIVQFSIGKRYYIEKISENEAITSNEETDSSDGKEETVIQGDVYMPDEYFRSDTDQSFTIVGIIKPQQNKSYYCSMNAYAGISSNVSFSAPDFYFQLHDINKKIFVMGEKIAANAGIYTGTKNAELTENRGSDYDSDTEGYMVRLRFNTELLRYYGVSTNDTFVTMMYSLAVIAIVIIILGSVSLIYNAFAISLSERSRYLGMLASVGATRNQKKGSVFFEGLIIGGISIPIGILSGIAGIGITLRLMRPMIGSLIGHVISSADFVEQPQIRLCISGAGIIAAVVCSVLTIFISTWIPARRACKIGPMEAIRSTKEVKLTRREVKTSRLIRIIFGFEGELGLKNLKRNSGRYRATVISLIISIVLFLSMSVLTRYLENSFRMSSPEIQYDIRLNDFGDKQQIDQYLTKLSNVLERTDVNELSIWMALMPADINKEQIMQNTQLDEYSHRIILKGLDDTSLLKYAKKAGVDMDDLKDTQKLPVIFVNQIRSEGNGKYTKKKYKDFKEHESLRLLYEQDYDLEGTAENKRMELNLLIAGITDEIPFGGNYAYYEKELVFYTSHEVVQSISERIDTQVQLKIFLRSDHLNELLKELLKIQKEEYPDLYIENVTAQREKAEQTVLAIKVFTYGFLVLITAICVANILNTVTTSIALRKREFAMLKSVGMEPNSFRKMINYESIFYGLKALLYGLPLSLAAMLLIYRTVSGSFIQDFVMPWGSIAAAIITVFAIVVLTMLYSSSKVRKENIIDALKEENL